MTVPLPEYGGCPWPVDTACFTDEWDTFSPEVRERAVALASATLRRLTGYRVTNCPITVRPCHPRTAYLYGSMPYYLGVGWRPENWAGVWINSCGHSGMCGCTTACEVRLPAPVSEVSSVKVNGSVVDPDNYRIDNGNLLVWQGTGDCPWPVAQDLSRPDTEPGTFSVTYLNGYPVDYLGAYAAGILAMEYGRACAGNSCRLPSGVTTIVRQGITLEVEKGAFPNGMTGIREVDTYIALWNPKGRMHGAAVWTPDIATPRINTGGTP